MHYSLRTQSQKFGRIYDFELYRAAERAALRRLSGRTTAGYSSSTQTREEEVGLRGLPALLPSVPGPPKTFCSELVPIRLARAK